VIIHTPATPTLYRWASIRKIEMSVELDLCFIEATDTIHEAVRHLLDEESCGEQLKEDLLQWQHGVSKKREERQETAEYCLGESVIPFDLVVKIHEHLKIHPLG
jgi:hypothetical protein